MTERELQELLASTPLRDTGASEERAWRVVRAAQAGAVADRRAARKRPRSALVGLCALAVTAIVLATASPPRQALARWIRQAIGIATPRAQPATLAGLPSGELLVNSAGSSWVVGGDGGRWRLGITGDAQLSPHGLFVLGWRGSVLRVVSPHGAPQWTLETPAQVKLASWSADGYRIAYLAGNSLRVVAGDGSGDHALVADVAALAPAWRPASGTQQLIALLDATGALQLRNADTDTLIWRRRPAVAPDALLWSPNGRFLATLAPQRITLYDAGGRLVAKWSPGAGERVGAAAFAPAGNRLGIVLRSRAAPSETVETLLATPAGLHRAPALLLSVPEQISGLAWSPDGRWLLAASPSADQWTLIHAQAPVSLRSISHVASRFEAPGSGSAPSFPVLGGWRR